MIMNLVSKNNSLLYQKVEPFNFSDPPIDPKELAQTLIENLVHHKGVGLSANQIGLPYRVFAINTDPEKIVCFNPTVTYYSEDMSVMTEGCLTFPLLYVKIRRPSNIRAKFYDEKGDVKTLVLNGLISRCYQHELDHLDGIDFTSRATKYHLTQATRKQQLTNRKLKKLKKIAGDYDGN
jgi:peptide deformylase